MADIFGYKRNPKPDKVFSVEDTILTMSGGQSVVGALIQNWSVNYSQNVQEIFELGSSKLYWVKGRPAGQGAIGKAIGDTNIKFFSNDAYDVCSGGATFDLTAGSGICSGGSAKEVKLSMGGCVVTSVGFSMTVADTRLMEQISWRFAALTQV